MSRNVTFIRPDGSVQSANTPSWSNTYEKLRHGLYRVQLDKVGYPDDEKDKTGDNLTSAELNKEVVYTGIVLSSTLGGQTLTNIRDGVHTSGEKDNFSERIYTVNRDKEDYNEEDPPQDQIGAIVYVGFLNGDVNFPVIVGCGTNFNQTLENVNKGVKTKRWQYNGIYFGIDEKGVLSVSKKDEFSISLNNKAIEIKTGKVTLKIDGESGEVEIEAEKIKIWGWKC